MTCGNSLETEFHHLNLEAESDDEVGLVQVVGVLQSNLLAIAPGVVVREEGFVHVAHRILVVERICDYRENWCAVWKTHIFKSVGIREEPWVQRNTYLDSRVFNSAPYSCYSSKGMSTYSKFVKIKADILREIQFGLNVLLLGNFIDKINNFLLTFLNLLCSQFFIIKFFRQIKVCGFSMLILSISARSVLMINGEDYITMRSKLT